MKRLNLVFAATALVLLLGTVLLVLADYNRQWRHYQRDGNAWLVAMTQDAAAAANDASVKREHSELAAKRAELEASLPHAEIGQLQAKFDKALEVKKTITLEAAVLKGEIGPLTQQIERLTLERGEKDGAVGKLINKRAELQGKFAELDGRIRSSEDEMASVQSQIDEKKAQLLAIQKQIADIERKQNAVAEKLATLNPTGAAKLGNIIRNAPLLDWFNPSEKVQQVVVPDVRTDLNFLTVETIDRCQSCHVNIDNPAFEETNLLMFAERQLAMAQGQNVDVINHPVVLRGFWEDAARKIGLDSGLEKLREQTLTAVNALRKGKGDAAITIEQLDAELDRIAAYSGEDRATWYKPLAYYLADVKALLTKAMGDEPFGQLRGLYRHQLVAAYNAARGEKGLPELSSSPVLLGHPRMDLFVEADSSHPMKTMGCTVCHEGAGQETQFIHTAHSPREMWVDASTGAPVPAVLVEAKEPGHEEHAAHAKPQALQLAGVSADATQIAVAAVAATEAAKEHGHVDLAVQHDVNLANPRDPAPFAPAHGAHGEKSYGVPGTDVTAFAITQEEYWKKAHGWEHVHYMHWEKPMHSLEYVQSACNRCHTEVFDIKNEAPKLFEGRKLFVQMGCAGCHAVENVLTAADFKLMGPSLVHVKEKLSHEMLASWIWSPKAFRPMTKMPHFFMLENNSTPVDILRTRVETTAMAQYLLHAEPDKSYYEKNGKPLPKYEPETAPTAESLASLQLPGTPEERGRIIFNNVGCLACHTNMAETGQKWIVDDLKHRKGLSDEEARAEYEAMGKDQPDGGYNARHWYAMEHLRGKITQIGPEISGVGTKLLAGRTPEQARAWAYDWVRNPRHYSDYTIMPSLRLSESEASDLVAYLLSLKRPGYEPDKFAMGDSEKAMLGQLIEVLDPARTISREAKDIDQQMMFVGKKMIAHYGCNGCHVVPGMEATTAPCTTLDEWGLKDPHKLDFGYFDHAFDEAREKPFTVHRVAHEGLTADAPHIKAIPETRDAQGKIAAESKIDPKIETEAVAWEGMHALERRPWLYHKLHNTRVYDRGRTQLDGNLDNLTSGKPEEVVGKPYDKLKMPKFFLTDGQVQSLVTFVTSIRKPLVADAMLVGKRPENKMLARGRQTAEMFNCYGCHNIEGNPVLIQQYFDVVKADGTFDYDKLNNAPPRLLGQGSKTQPDWLAYFLNNVHPLRPWLRIRMPSYPLDVHSTQQINDYFASASVTLAEHTGGIVEPIEAFIKNGAKDAAWWTAPAVAPQVARLKAWGLTLDLVKLPTIDPRTASDADQAKAWNKLLKDVKFFTGLNEIEYPFPVTPRPQLSPEQFARGEALFNELRCFQCHAVGDEATLAKLHDLETKSAPATTPTPAEDEGDDYGAAPEPAKPQAAAEEDDDYGSPTPAATTEAKTLGLDDVMPARLIGGKLYTAPNLSFTASRLRWDWFHRWLMEPATIQPGTAMPQWFPGGHSAFSNFPAAAKERAESIYGYSGDDQMKLLMEWVYAMGNRNYTPGAEKLYGVEQPKIELTALERPKPKAGEEEAKLPGAQASPEAQAVVEAPKVEAPKPVVEAATSSIELHEGAIDFQGTRVVGVVTFGGETKKRRPLRMEQDPFCKSAHTTAVLDQSLIVSPKGELKDAFIYVKSGLSGGPYEIPDDKKTPVIDQHGCMYAPHVMGMIAGQDLTILNSDNTLHNVKMESTSNGSFNEGMPVAGMQMQKPFSKPELGVKFACNVHPWMGATLHVVEHPFFAVSDIEGRYEIKGLPPGSYTLEVIHGMTSVGAIQVTVEANKSVRADTAVSGK